MAAPIGIDNLTSLELTDAGGNVKPKDVVIEDMAKGGSKPVIRPPVIRPPAGVLPGKNAGSFISMPSCWFILPFFCILFQ